MDWKVNDALNSLVRDDNDSERVGYISKYIESLLNTIKDLKDDTSRTAYNPCDYCELYNLANDIVNDQHFVAANHQKYRNLNAVKEDLNRVLRYEI